MLGYILKQTEQLLKIALQNFFINGILPAVTGKSAGEVGLPISAGITPVQVRTPVITPESISLREPASLEDLRALIRGINPEIEGHIMKLAFTLCKKMVEIIF